MKRLLSLLVILLAVSACRKNKDNSPVYQTSTSYLSESIKPYKFKGGGYWVFQNDSTSVLDSIIVTSVVSDFCWSMPPVHDYPGQRSEFYTINLKSITTSQTYNDYLSNNYIKRNGGGEYGQNGQPIFMAGSDTGATFNGMKIVAKFPSIIINGNVFNNVVETKITAAQQYQLVFANDTYLYFTPTTGLIKKVTALGNGQYESWSIKRWSVVK